MRRHELEHILRAAGAITGISEWVIVGSQAILASHPDAPPEIVASEEVDIYAPADPAAADLIDGSIGEISPFHQSFGYYAHGVGIETALLPSEWRTRAVTIHTPETGGVTGICPDSADIAISKLAAGREKDRDFVDALIRHGITTADAIRGRLGELPPPDAERIARDLRFIERSQQ